MQQAWPIRVTVQRVAYDEVEHVGQGKDDANCQQDIWFSISRKWNKIKLVLQNDLLHAEAIIILKDIYEVVSAKG